MRCRRESKSLQSTSMRYICGIVSIKPWADQVTWSLGCGFCILCVHWSSLLYGIIFGTGYFWLMLRAFVLF